MAKHTEERFAVTLNAREKVDYAHLNNLEDVTAPDLCVHTSYGSAVLMDAQYSVIRTSQSGHRYVDIRLDLLSAFRTQGDSRDELRRALAESANCPDMSLADALTCAPDTLDVLTLGKFAAPSGAKNDVSYLLIAGYGTKPSTGRSEVPEFAVAVDVPATRIWLESQWRRPEFTRKVFANDKKGHNLTDSFSSAFVAVPLTEMRRHNLVSVDFLSNGSQLHPLPCSKGSCP